jgi:hypothetical protein
MSAAVHHAGEGERYAMGASEVTIKATGEDTGSAFFVAEIVLEAGFPGPPPHFHERLHETLYAPAGWEHYLRELAAAARGDGLTPALMAEIASRHDFHRA